jgi:hypothetical protein
MMQKPQMFIFLPFVESQNVQLFKYYFFVIALFKTILVRMNEKWIFCVIETLYMFLLLQSLKSLICTFEFGSL